MDNNLVMMLAYAISFLRGLEVRRDSF